MFGKIAIRNIPPAVWEGLESLAGQHDRSTEAEARYALRSWVEPLLQRNERSARCAEVSARMRELLDQVNSVPRRGWSLKPSHIAQAIGEDHAEAVENWFTGQVEPSFKQLDAVAEYLGGASSWLKHSDGSMFPVQYDERIPEIPAEGVSWLLKSKPNECLTGLFFVRKDDEIGSLAIIKKYGDSRCMTYSTPYHVSEAIGAGGEASLAHLSVIWRLLYKHYTKLGTRLIIKSYLLSEPGFRSLQEGKIHPLTILRESGQDVPWWEDFWDVSQYPQHNYWP
ncbi:MAG: hypothetical protein M3Q16_02235, partial [Pseudomonadota bacterium]|nr:hypothetical protein [Pseudomonadota bacterium]